jgi:hypothetical protein
MCSTGLLGLGGVAWGRGIRWSIGRAERRGPGSVSQVAVCCGLPGGSDSAPGSRPQLLITGAARSGLRESGGAAHPCRQQRHRDRLRDVRRTEQSPAAARGGPGRSDARLAPGSVRGAGRRGLLRPSGRWLRSRGSVVAEGGGSTDEKRGGGATDTAHGQCHRRDRPLYSSPEPAPPGSGPPATAFGKAVAHRKACRPTHEHPPRQTTRATTGTEDGQHPVNTSTLGLGRVNLCAGGRRILEVGQCGGQVGRRCSDVASSCCARVFVRVFAAL